MNYKIENKQLCALISDMGAELISLKKHGVEFLWQGKDPFWKSHAPLLFPICGSLIDQKYTFNGVEYDMPFHGFARRMTFSVLEHNDESIVMKLESCDETKKIYPFDFELIAKFELFGDELFVNYDVTNKSQCVMPYMLGWHPGFILPGECPIDNFHLSLEKSEQLNWYPLQHGGFVRPYGEKYEIKNGLFPLNEKEIYKNDTMIFTGAGRWAILGCSEQQVILRLRWRDEDSYLCIWKNPDSSARFICIEPWSDVPSDGETKEDFNIRKMSRLAPQDTKSYQYGIKIN